MAVPRAFSNNPHIIIWDEDLSLQRERSWSTADLDQLSLLTSARTTGKHRVTFANIRCHFIKHSVSVTVSNKVTISKVWGVPSLFHP